MGPLYVERYFKHRDDTIMNPRTGGQDPSIIDVPPLCAALLDYFSSKLKKPILDALQKTSSTSKTSFRRLLLDHIEKDRLFGCIADQIHWGAAAGSPEAGRHVDSVNSVLHLAITLRGTRALHFDAAQEHMTSRAIVLPPGSVYLSSPAAFVHSVQYPTTNLTNRVEALQCRLALTQSESKKLQAAAKNQGEFLAVMADLADALNHSNVFNTMPTLQDLLS